MRPIVAKDLMTSDVLTAREDMTVSDLATFLSENEITGAPVENRDGEVVGVVSVVDIARADSEKTDRSAWDAVGSDTYHHDWDRRLDDGIRVTRLRDDRVLVRDIMNTSVHSIGEDAAVTKIVEKMLQYHLHRLLVVEDGRLVGLVSTSDLLGLLLDRE